VGAPDYDVLDLGNDRTLWLFRDWNLPDSIGEWVNVSADDLRMIWSSSLALMNIWRPCTW